MSTYETANGVGDAYEPLGPEHLAAFAALRSDTTGLTTFERYVWQAKLAVRSWLGALADAGLLAVVCEHVEDLAIVHVAGFRFAQLKTRDKGSWSVANICRPGHAIERLVASYKLADASDIAAFSSFEVWLEGPPSEKKETNDFFADPTSASEAIKKQIRAFGLTGAKLTDFLNRLSIHCHQPARQAVDAVNIRLIGAIWPGQTMEQVERLYETLLCAAVSAQSASEAPQIVRRAIRAAREAPASTASWHRISIPHRSAASGPLSAVGSRIRSGPGCPSCLWGSVTPRTQARPSGSFRGHCDERIVRTR